MINDYDIAIKIGKKVKEGETTFPVMISLSDGRKTKGSFKHLEILGRSIGEIGRELAENLFRDEVLALALDGIERAAKEYYFGRILLEIKTPELYSLPWETVLNSYPFINSQIHFRLIRLYPFLSELALVPFTLPIDLLIARLESEEDTSWDPTILPTEPLKYFRSTVAYGVTMADLQSLLGGRQFEVIRLQGLGYWGKNSKSMLGAGPGEESLDCSQLRVLLKKSHTRLLVLEACSQDYEPLLDLGHRLLDPCTIRPS